MADDQDTMKRIGATRGKLVLIGILAVVLVSVIYLQYGPDGAEEPVAAGELVYSPPVPPAAAATPAPSAPAPSTAPTTSTPAIESSARASSDSSDQQSSRLADSWDEGKWQSPDVEVVVGYDPFALPPGFPRPTLVAGDPQGLLSGESEADSAQARASQLADAVAKLHSELESLRQRGVHVIVRQRDGYVAMIGDRTVRVGDEINGFTVTSIDQNGVRVERNIEQ